MVSCLQLKLQQSTISCSPGGLWRMFLDNLSKPRLFKPHNGSHCYKDAIQTIQRNPSGCEVWDTIHASNPFSLQSLNDSHSLLCVYRFPRIACLWLICLFLIHFMFCSHHHLATSPLSSITGIPSTSPCTLLCSLSITFSKPYGNCEGTANVLALPVFCNLPYTYYASHHYLFMDISSRSIVVAWSEGTLQHVSILNQVSWDNGQPHTQHKSWTFSNPSPWLLMLAARILTCSNLYHMWVTLLEVTKSCFMLFKKSLQKKKGCCR